MRDYLKEYAIERYINAHDTITLYGASRMAENVLEAARQAAGTFVDIMQMQRVLGERIAHMTHNEAAYIANCAAGALQLCAAVCIAGDSAYAYKRLPDTSGRPDEIIVLHSQHNCYDKALESAGAKIRLVGDADEALDFDLKNCITEKTAAVFYCPAATFKRGSLPLEQVAQIAHAQGVPIIVDAAAQLPPVSNLWTYAQQGGDMVVFSGGKTLCGPQASGLIVGKKAYIERCIQFGSPMHGICRSSKVSREEMIALCVAIENYMAMDHETEKKRCSLIVDQLIAAMHKNSIFEPYRVEQGSVGQDYPRAFARVRTPHKPQNVIRAMRANRVIIGLDTMSNSIYISPLNLTQEECDVVCDLLERITLEE